LKSFKLTLSSFREIALFLAERYQLETSGLEPPVMELLIDGTLPLELREEGRHVYLIGTVLDSVLVAGKDQARKLLELASQHLGFSEGVLAWDPEQERYIFWMEVGQYTRESEFNEHLDRFLSQLLLWMKLVPLQATEESYTPSSNDSLRIGVRP
jgi:hypothetical protein